MPTDESLRPFIKQAEEKSLKRLCSITNRDPDEYVQTMNQTINDNLESSFQILGRAGPGSVA